MERRHRLVSGIALVVVGFVAAFSSFYLEGLIECADPGGCREVPLISWPVLSAGIVLAILGIVVLAIPGIRIAH